MLLRVEMPIDRFKSEGPKIHGELGTGNWRDCRWCDGCNKYHGNLYNCKHYPIKLQKEIAEKSRRFQKVPPQRLEEFLEEIRAVCRKHKLQISALDCYTIAVSNLRIDEEPIPSDDVEDFTSF